MRIHRLYYPDLTSATSFVTLDKSASRYLLQVLRCKPGQTIQLFNGEGTQCEGTLESAGKNTATVKLSHCDQVTHESPLHIRLVLGISKGDRMDIAIQKAVELGVTEILPIHTEFGVVNLSADRAQKRLSHWQGIIINACEQCGRNHLPTLHPVQTFAQWLTSQHGDVLWLFDPESQLRLSQQGSPNGSITILIGPEGGLSADEISSAQRSGFKSILFGPRILRTETAVIATLSAIQTLWGDLG
jgi:16S rRNA (uracil1498-N3)-methyltransferase